VHQGNALRQGSPQQGFPRYHWHGTFPGKLNDVSFFFQWYNGWAY
jgi:hypothetical protein